MSQFASGHTNIATFENFFTDREHYIHLFDLCNQKLDQETSVPVLAFFGVNGIGKSTLLNHLYSRCQQSQRTPSLRTCAHLSFDRGWNLDETPKALWSLREQVQSSTKKYIFARFDLFWGALWERTYQLPIDTNKELSSGERKWLKQVLDQIEVITSSLNIPFSGLFFRVVQYVFQHIKRQRGKKVVANVAFWFEQHSKTPKGTGLKTALRRFSPSELVEWLPRAFAADLADMAKQTPVILFIDSYDILKEREDQRYGGEASTFLEILAEELMSLQAKVLLVMASCDRLRWAESQRSDGKWVLNRESLWAQDITLSPDDFNCFVSATLEQYRIDDFSEKDSLTYLTQHRKLLPERAQEIYNITGGYPFGLSLVADLLEEAGPDIHVDLTKLRARLLSQDKPFTPKWCAELEEWLLKKLLEHLDVNQQQSLRSLVRVAAIPRWFTEDLLFHIARSYNVQDDFKKLVSYSFVEPMLTGQAYRLHPRIRELLRHSIHNEVQRKEWEQAAKKWFSDKIVEMTGSERQTFRLEALYHLWYLEPLQAIDELDKLFDDPSLSQVEFRWSILSTATEVENKLPANVQLRLKLLRAELYQLTFSQIDKPGANKQLALIAAEEARRLAEGMDEAAKGRAYFAVAEALNLLQRFPEAVLRVREACEAAQQVGDTKTLALGLCRRATIETQDNPEFGNSALLRKARRLLMHSKTDQTEARIMRQLLGTEVQLSLRFERWQEFEKAMSRLADFETDIYQKIAFLQYYGEAYTLQGMWEKAIPYLKDALTLASGLDFRGGMCAATGWWGIALCLANQDEEGMLKVHEALTIEKELLGSREGVAKWLAVLGELVYIKRGQWKLALEVLWIARILYEELHHIQLDRISRLLHEIQGQMNEEDFRLIQASFIPQQSEFAQYVVVNGG